MTAGSPGPSAIADPPPATEGAGAAGGRISARRQVPTLLYHGVAPLPARPGYLARALFVEPGRFLRQMDLLARRGYRTVRLGEYARMLDGEGPSSSRRFLLTFDDAYAHLDHFVTPVLRRYGFSAVVFVPLAHLGGANDWDRSHPLLFGTRIMGRRELTSLDPDLWEVESHGVQHIDLRGQEPEVRRRQLRDGRASLSELLGRRVTALAYPYGRHDAGVRRDAAAAGFELAFTASGYGPREKLRLPRRPISGWDPLSLFRLRTAAVGPMLYRVEDAARTVAGLRRLL